jgi:DNA-binding beta-propeller fold protein YncE
MRTPFSSRQRHKTFWWSAMLCFPLLVLLSACNTQQTHANKAPAHTPSCIAFAPGSTHRGATAALVATIPLPDHPFKAVATDDGHWLFVSLVNTAFTSGALAVLQKRASQICLERVIPLPGVPLGMTLSHDQHILVIADYSQVAFVDVAQAEHGTQGALLGSVPETHPSSTIEVTLSVDEHYVFAANESDGTVSVIDFQRIRAHDFRSDVLLGQIPVGTAPVGMAVSPDNRWLYITSEIDTRVTSLQSVAKNCGNLSQGSLTIASIARVGIDPAHSIIRKVVAGCSPVRVVLSPTGDIVWVTARGDNSVLAFDTARLLSGAGGALLASVTVGPAPVGLALIDKGAALVVANSNRFQEPDTPQSLTVLDARHIRTGRAGVLATLKVGAFPRELTLEANGATLLLTNYDSDTLSIIDVTKLSRPA